MSLCCRAEGIYYGARPRSTGKYASWLRLASHAAANARRTAMCGTLSARAVARSESSRAKKRSGVRNVDLVLPRSTEPPALSMRTPHAGDHTRADQ
jgi:hypothetical protein